MSNNIKLRKGLDLPLRGAAETKVLGELQPDVVAVKPTDFKGLVPKLLVKEGDTVKAGSPLFADKMRPEILFTSPVSGTVQAVVRGEKRKLLAVTVKADKKQAYEDFGIRKVEDMSATQIKELLCRSGLWASLVQRPYGIVADPDATVKAVFISAFDSAPCAPDIDFVIEGQTEYFQEGVNVLKKLTGTAIHLSLDAAQYNKSPLHHLENVILHIFKGRHPAGNVGVQIHHIDPIRKGETVWTISPVMLCAIGRLFRTGRLEMDRLVAVTGPKAPVRGYYRTVAGACVKDFGGVDGSVRVISGNVLHGTDIGPDGFLGFFDNQVTYIAEGNYKEMFGWMNPLRLKLFSASHSYLSWLCPFRKYDMDTNIHGGVRPFMFNNVYSDVLPMHIFPVYLCKACLAGDIDKMEMFGIYEVLPEDLATCEFVCPSKIEWQDIIEKGIDLMLKEMV